MYNMNSTIDHSPVHHRESCPDSVYFLGRLFGLALCTQLLLSSRGEGPLVLGPLEVDLISLVEVLLECPREEPRDQEGEEVDGEVEQVCHRQHSTEPYPSHILQQQNLKDDLVEPKRENVWPLKP